MKICYGSYNELIPFEHREVFAKAFAKKLQDEIKAKSGEDVEIVCCPERGDLVAAMDAGYEVVLTESKLRRPEGGSVGEENVGVGTLKEWTSRKGVKRVILILPESDRPSLGKREDGTDCFTSGRKVVELYRKGFYDALYVSDLKCDLLIDLIKNGRGDTDAKKYYGVTDEMIGLLLAAEQKKDKKEKEKKKGIFGNIFGRGQAEGAKEEPVKVEENHAEVKEAAAANEKPREPVKKETVQAKAGDAESKVEENQKESVVKPIAKEEESENAKASEIIREEGQKETALFAEEKADADEKAAEPVKTSEVGGEASKGGDDAVPSIINEVINKEVIEKEESKAVEDGAENRKTGEGGETSKSAAVVKDGKAVANEEKAADDPEMLEVMKALISGGTDQFFEDDGDGDDSDSVGGFDFGSIFGGEASSLTSGTESGSPKATEVRRDEWTAPLLGTEGTVGADAVAGGEEAGYSDGRITSFLNGGTLITIQLTNPPSGSDVSMFGVTVFCKGSGVGRVVNGRYQSNTTAFDGYCVRLISGRTLLIEVPDSEAPQTDLSGRDCMVTFKYLQ